MAISFPGSKSNGQKFTSGNKSWTWNGSSWKGATSSGGDAVTLGGISESSFLRSDADDITSGKLTIDSTGQLYVRYNNSDSYRAGLDWNVFQLGNNGQNKLVAGKNTVGGYFQFYVNNTSDVVGGSATNGTASMTLAANGKVGIGTTDPKTYLDVSSNSTQLRLHRPDGAGDDWRMYSWGDGLNIFPQTASTVWFGRDGATTDVALYNGRLAVNHTGAPPAAYAIYANGSIWAKAGAGDGGGVRIHSNSGINVSGNVMSFHTGQTDGFTFNGNSNGADGNNQLVVIKSDGNVGIGDSTPSYKLDVAGDIRATGDVITNSDARLKSDVRTISNPRQLIAGLSGKLYTKDDKENQLGFIAQQVEEILPQLVHTANDEMGTKSVNYQGVIALLVEAVKDLQQQVDELKGNK